MPRNKEHMFLMRDYIAHLPLQLRLYQNKNDSDSWTTEFWAKFGIVNYEIIA